MFDVNAIEESWVLARDRGQYNAWRKTCGDQNDHLQ